jgi:dihydrofolate synthase/folylpolyglutamate synthase
VISSIGLDHTDWLGPTLEHIGAEKAGILRAGGAAVLGSADMPASVRTAIESLRVDARWPGRDFQVIRDVDGHWQYLGREWQLRDLPPSALGGAIQYANAAAALAALEALSRARPALRTVFAPATFAQGLRAVRLAGRFQVVAGSPEWILDVAHNVPAAEGLAANLRARPTAGRSIAVVGILADKDVAGIGRTLAPCIDEWVLCGLDGPRGSDAAALRYRLPPECAPLSLVTDVVAACELARSRARPEDRIVVLGSFHTVGPALQWLGL